MRFLHLHILLLVSLLIAGCDRSGGDQAGGGGRATSGTPADAMLAEAKAVNAAIREQTGGAAAPSALSMETTTSGGPKRRDGWWEISSEGAVTDTQHLCVGGGSEEGWSLYDSLLFSVGECSKKSLTRQGAAWRFDLVCDSFGTALTIQGRMSGDFRDSFHMEQSGTVNGAPRSATIRGVHKGSCPAKFKAGDVVSDGRVLFNMANK